MTRPRSFSFCIVFSIVYSLTYLLAVKNNYALFTYHPALEEFGEPGNRKTVVKIIVEATDVSGDIAEQTLKLFFEPERNVLPQQGEINLRGLAQVISFMSEAGAIKQPLPEPQSFVDLQYLQAAGMK